jgi:hypothetical protein
MTTPDDVAAVDESARAEALVGDLGEDVRLDPRERDLEAPEADAAEQATPADPAAAPRADPSRSLEVNEYDALEQARIVELEDDYR